MHPVAVGEDVDDGFVVEDAGEAPAHGADRRLVGEGVVARIDVAAEDDVVIEKVRGASGGLAAKVRQRPADDHGLDVTIAQDVVEVGPGEGIVRVLDPDHPLIGARVDLVVDVGAGRPFFDGAGGDGLPELVEVGAAVAGDVVGAVDHRHTARTAGLDRPLDPRDLSVRFRHAHGVLRVDEVFLEVDDDERALLALDLEGPVPVHVIVAIGELNELPLALEYPGGAEDLGAQQVVGRSAVHIDERPDGIREVLARHRGLLRGESALRTHSARPRVKSSGARPPRTSGA